MTQATAMFWALGGYFLWVLVDASIKFTSQENLSPYIIMACLGIVGAAGCFGWALFKRDLGLLRPQRPGAQALLGLYAIVINFSNIFALKHLPLTVFYIVVFTCPLVIAAVSALLKHEKLTRIKIACLVAGFLGVVIAIGLNSEGIGDSIGYIAAGMSVLSFCASAITMQRMSKTASAGNTMFIRSLFVGAAGVLGLLIFETPAPVSFEPLAIMLIAGALNTLGMVFYIVGLQNTTSTNVAQLHYTQIIFGGVFGYFLWNEVPTWNLVLGSIVIIASGMVVAAEAHKNKASL